METQLGTRDTIAGCQHHLLMQRNYLKSMLSLDEEISDVIPHLEGDC